MKPVLIRRFMATLCALAALSLLTSPTASAVQPLNKTVWLIAIEVAPGIKVTPGSKVPGSERLPKRLRNQLTVEAKFNVPGNFWTVRAKPGLSVARTKRACRQLIASKKIRNCEQMGTFG